MHLREREEMDGRGANGSCLLKEEDAGLEWSQQRAEAENDKAFRTQMHFLFA